MAQVLLLQELKKAGLSLELVIVKIIKFKIQIVSIIMHQDNNMRKLKIIRTLYISKLINYYL
jgi:hypothetical protein